MTHMTQRYKIDPKDFTGRELVAYIWDYYRWWILAGLVFLAIVGGWLYGRITEKPPVLNIMMINTASETESDSFNDFLEQNGYEVREDAVAVYDSFRFMEGENIEYMNMQYEQALYAMLHSGEYEIFIGNGRIFDNYVNEGMLADLSTLLPQELLSQYEEELIYSDYFGQQQSYPCAVSFENDTFALQNMPYDDEYCVGVMYNADQPEAAAEFMEYLLTCRQG